MSNKNTALNPAVKNMSIKNMTRTIYDILIDNGMPDKDASDTVANMSTKDMERYLSEILDA